MKFDWLKSSLLFAVALTLFVPSAATGTIFQDADEKSSDPSVAEFDDPFQLKAGSEFIRVESPGYAAPCLADMNGDGLKDLIVGQFNDGKMKVYLSQGDGKFSEGQWLEVDGKPAEIPGVW